MTSLTFYLSLIGNVKPNPLVSESRQIGHHFMELASEYCNIKHSKYHPNNEGKSRKDIYLPMIYLFHGYKVYSSEPEVKFQFSNYREYYICLVWLDQIDHRYETTALDFVVKTDIKKNQYCKYLYLSQI